MIKILVKKNICTSRPHFIISTKSLGGILQARMRATIGVLAVFAVLSVVPASLSLAVPMLLKGPVKLVYFNLRGLPPPAHDTIILL